MPGKKRPKAYVFDTSALLAYIEDEDGANEVDDLLAKAENSVIQAHVCFISLTEVFYITLREKDEATVKRRVDEPTLYSVRGLSLPGTGTGLTGWTALSPRRSTRNPSCSYQRSSAFIKPSDVKYKKPFVTMMHAD